MKENSWLYPAVALIVGVIVGWAVGHSSPSMMAGVNTSQPAMMAFDTKSSNLRLNLNSLLKEHTVMGGTELLALYDGKDVSQLDTLMMANANNVSALVQDAYGTSAHDEFSKLWMMHMQDYKNYTEGKRDGDQAKMDSAKKDLDDIAAKMGSDFNSWGGNLPAADVTSLFKAHVKGTLDLVDAHAASDMVMEANLMKNGYDQAGQMADALAKGIIADKPDLFK